MISLRHKELAIILLLCFVIGFSAFRIVGYWRAPNYNVALHRGVGMALADEVLALISQTGRVAVLTVDPKQYPALQTQLEAFHRQLKKKSSVTMGQLLLIDSSRKRKVGPGAGLTGKEFLELTTQCPDVDAVVSLVGTPGPIEDITGSVRPPFKLIAETQARGKLRKLFEHGLLQTAIVPRFSFPAPGPGVPHTPEEWFQRNFQILKAPAPSNSL